MTNSFHAKQYLSISSKELIWVQLFHQLIQRKVNNMFLPGIGHRKCDFILGIEISHVTHFQRTETFPSRNEKASTIGFLPMPETIEDNIQVTVFRRCICSNQCFIFHDRLKQTFLIHGFQDIVYTIYRESPNRVLIISRGKNNHGRRASRCQKTERISIR